MSHYILIVSFFSGFAETGGVQLAGNCGTALENFLKTEVLYYHFFAKQIDQNPTESKNSKVQPTLLLFE